MKLDLKVNGQHITNYYIDFIIFHNDGSKEYVETKGYPTDLWRIKWAILEATFDDFKEDPDDCLTVVKQSSLPAFCPLSGPLPPSWRGSAKCVI